MTVIFTGSVSVSGRRQRSWANARVHVDLGPTGKPVYRVTDSTGSIVHAKITTNAKPESHGGITSVAGETVPSLSGTAVAPTITQVIEWSTEPT